MLIQPKYYVINIRFNIKNAVLVAEKTSRSVLIQHNLVFLPKVRQFNDKEIYTLGRLNMYIEQGVCFVSDGAGDWVPTSIVKLFVKA